jgi:hypothetical protein
VAARRESRVVNDQQLDRRLAVIGAKPGRRIGDLGPREPADDPASEPLQPLLRAREVLDSRDRAVADDHVGFAGEDRGQQLRDVRAAVLVVGVGVDDQVGAELQAGVESRLECGGQAAVVGQADELLDTVLAGDLDGSIGRAVVDHEQLDLIHALDAARQVGDRARKRRLLVEAGDLDDQLHGRGQGTARTCAPPLSRPAAEPFAGEA